MKKIYSHIIFLFIICYFFALKANGQIESFVQQKLNTINCNSSTFWLLCFNGSNFSEVYELSKLNNNTINLNNTISSNCPGVALAISNNLNGGAISPTFYTNNLATPFQDMPFYYDSLLWSFCGIMDSSQLSNAGGLNNYVYYTGTEYQSTLNKFIFRFDGDMLVKIYQTPLNVSIAVADIAVDLNQNVWFFTKEDSLPFYATLLNVIDSNGFLLNQYSTYFDILNAYGMCIMEDSLFIGFGYQNTTYPNSLVSVALNVTSASLNNVIPMPILSASSINYDLASCNPGVPTGFKNIRKPPAEQISVYPNPATNKITIDHIPKNVLELTVINSMGAIIFQQKLHGENKLDLFTASYAPGMYAVCIKTNTEVLVRKWIKGKM